MTQSCSFYIPFFWLCIAILPAGGSEDDTRFLDGLRQRQLFELAESYCRQQAAQKGLSPVQRATIAIEAVRTYTAHAVNSPPEQREALWQSARDAAEQFCRDDPGNPRRILVQVQDALTDLARGELARQEAEVLANPGDALIVARQAIREAAKRLEEIDRQLTQQVRLRYRDPGPPDALTAAELISLQHHVRFHQARAFRNRALCYAKDSDDQLAALTAAVDALNEPLNQISPDDPLYWQLQADRLACLRLLGQMDQAYQLLQSIDQTAPPTNIQLQLRAEAVRLALDRKRPDEALAILDRGRIADGQTSPELDYAALETYLALWQRSSEQNNSAEADRWRKQAVTMVEGIEQTHGAYWGRRADLLLVKIAGGSQVGGDVEVLVRTADNLYRKQQYEEAVAAYAQAGEAALAAGDRATAFSQFYKAALVEQTRRRHLPAAERFRSLALRLPDLPEAANAHLLAAWNLAQAARDDFSLLDQYVEVLKEQVERWPQAESANKARLWLGRIQENRKNWREAVQAFAGVPRTATGFPEAVEALARCWTNLLEQKKKQNEPVDSLAREAALQFERHLLDPPIEHWSPTARRCAETAARLLLDYVPDGHADAERLLQAAIDGNPSADAAWRNKAISLLVLAQAGQASRRNQAEQTLLGMGSGSPEGLLEVFSGLRQLAETASPAAKRDLAELQLAVIDRLQDKTAGLSPLQQHALRRARAEALLLAGQKSEAVAAYAALAAELPDDVQVQVAYAQLLLDSSAVADWSTALEAWRRIASRSKPRCETWYRARYGIALALFKLGEKEQAAARIRYLQTVPPGLDETPWKTKFLDLLQRCQP